MHTHVVVVLHWIQVRSQQMLPPFRDRFEKLPTAPNQAAEL